MRKRNYLVFALSVSLLFSASVPLCVSAEAQDEFFYSEEITEDLDQVNAEDFISDNTDNTETFSSQIEEYTVTEKAEDNNWTQLKSNSKVYYYYDSETQTLSFKASEPTALPDNNGQSGKNAEWYTSDIGNAKKIIIGDNITKIGQFDFYNNVSNDIIAYSQLEEVELSPSVVSIGHCAFCGVSSLKIINLNSVEEIASAAFYGSGVENATFEKDAVSIGDDAFLECTALESLTIKGIPTFGESSFKKCTALKSVQCDNMISKLPTALFRECSALTEFKVPGVKEIANEAFHSCSSLTTVDLSETESIGGRAFFKTGLEKANLKNIKVLAKYSLQKCNNLSEICFHGTKKEWDNIAIESRYPTDAVLHCQGDTVEAAEATCTETGWKETGVCNVCGQHYSDKNNPDNILPALGHNYSEEYTVDKPATCTEDGEKSKHCVNPGCEERDDVQKIDALGHDYVETTVAATCTEKGTLTKTCSRCNDVVTEEIPALGHDFAKDYTIDKKATCTTDGEQSRHCSRCDAREDVQKINAFGHDYVSKVTKEATCTEKGILTKTCSKCGDVVTEEIPALGHKFGDWKVTAETTVLAPEQQERICETCGAKETKAEGTALKATATVNASTVKLKVKQSTSGLKVTGLAKGDSVKTWKSTNTKIFTVKGKADGTCKLTAKKAGTAKLQITLASGLKKTVTVKVRKTAVKTTKVTVANTKVTVQKGKKVALKPVVKPFTSKQKVTYTSSNKKVATVSSKGVVTGKKKGTTKITVKSGSKSVKVTVKVK